MPDILEFSISKLIENDKTGEYRASVNNLSKRYSKLNFWKTSSKNQDNDEIVDEATKIYVDAILHADSLYKQAEFSKNSGFITKIILKTLKIAQKMLATLLFKSPLKVGIAYNAMHNVIKYLEREMKKKK